MDSYEIPAWEEEREGSGQIGLGMWLLKAAWRCSTRGQDVTHIHDLFARLCMNVSVCVVACVREVHEVLTCVDELLYLLRFCCSSSCHRLRKTSDVHVRKICTLLTGPGWGELAGAWWLRVVNRYPVLPLRRTGGTLDLDTAGHGNSVSCEARGR